MVSVVENPGDGYDASVDYGIPRRRYHHRGRLPCASCGDFEKIAKEILAARSITLDIKGIYRLRTAQQRGGEAAKLTPTISNTPPIWRTSTRENGTHLVAVATIHVEPWAFMAASKPVWIRSWG